MEIKKQNMTKMLVFTYHLKVQKDGQINQQIVLGQPNRSAGRSCQEERQFL